jgi:phosphotriesterase-related protein
MTEEGNVETARGTIPASALGRTLMHEHVFIVDMDVRHNYPLHLG